VSLKVVSAPWVLPGRPEDPGAAAAAIRDGAVALDGDVVAAVGPRAELEARYDRGEHLDAIVLPALVNAHLHLELSHLRGRVPGGDGLAAWVGRLMAERAAIGSAGAPAAMEAAAQELRAAGVAAVGEVSNTLASLEPLARAGLCGTVFHEVLGFTRERFERYREAARAERGVRPVARGLRVVESPHAIYSTHREALEALLEAGPSTIHLAEDPAEREFCHRGTGPFRRLLESLGVGAAEIDELRVRGVTPVLAVHRHLRPGHLLVHCVDLNDIPDGLRIGNAGAIAVLCPRSNRHISGLLPPLDVFFCDPPPAPRRLALAELAVGTDSLASSPSLAPLPELGLLRRAYPEVSAARLLPLAWNGSAVGAPHVGRLTPGQAPGVLAAPLGGVRPEDPFEFLLETFGADGETRPLRWLCSNGLEARA